MSRQRQYILRARHHATPNADPLGPLFPGRENTRWTSKHLTATFFPREVSRETGTYELTTGQEAVRHELAGAQGARGVRHRDGYDYPRWCSVAAELKKGNRNRGARFFFLSAGRTRAGAGQLERSIAGSVAHLRSRPIAVLNPLTPFIINRTMRAVRAPSAGGVHFIFRCLCVHTAAK